MVQGLLRFTGRVASVPSHLLLGARVDLPVQSQLAPGHVLRGQALPGVTVVQVFLRVPEGGDDVHGSKRAHRRAEGGANRTNEVSWREILNISGKS